jgi:hypothetical protein
MNTTEEKWDDFGPADSMMMRGLIVSGEFYMSFYHIEEIIFENMNFIRILLDS